MLMTLLCHWIIWWVRAGGDAHQYTVDGTYGVFVHYFDDKGGGLTTATLKVFMDGVEITTQKIC